MHCKPRVHPVDIVSLIKWLVWRHLQRALRTLRASLMTNSALDLLKNEHVEGTIARNTEYDILQHNDPNLLTYRINGTVYT